MSRSDELHAAAFSLTSLVLDPKFQHMRKPWEMLLGGLILPALVAEDASVLKTNPEYEKLYTQYTREKVLAFFAPVPAQPMPVETPAVVKPEAPKVAPVVLEAPKAKAPKVEAPKVEAPMVPKVIVKHLTPVSVEPAEKVGGKYRRLKVNGVDKVRRFERELEPNDRDYLIRWWNTYQVLVPEDDPVCARLAKNINDANASTSLKPLSPLQMAGYFSYLCTLGTWGADERNARIALSIKKGRFTVAPVYSGDLIDAIIANYNAERADEDVRRKAHAEKRAAMGMAKTTTSAPVIEAPVVEAPVVSLPEVIMPDPDEFDIKFSA